MAIGKTKTLPNGCFDGVHCKAILLGSMQVGECVRVSPLRGSEEWGYLFPSPVGLVQYSSLKRKRTSSVNIR